MYLYVLDELFCIYSNLNVGFNFWWSVVQLFAEIFTRSKRFCLFRVVLLLSISVAENCDLWQGLQNWQFLVFNQKHHILQEAENKKNQSWCI